MNRLGNVNEIANVVYWLASNENTYLTGQQIIVYGVIQLFKKLTINSIFENTTFILKNQN